MSGDYEGFQECEAVRVGSDLLYGGTGDDWLIGGALGDWMYGGPGDDTYDVNTLEDVVSEETADALGGVDAVFSSISLTLGFGLEDLWLKERQDLNGTGNGLNNDLHGNHGNNVLNGLGGSDNLHGDDGNDHLKGSEGRDRLDGGRGQDRLSGGDGHDKFVFVSQNQAGDTITDFRNKSGNNDRLLIDASNFKGGLEADGHLSAAQFQTGDDHQARDSDIRFIFDTSDETLWFDRNGDKAGGLTLVADLQASADLQANDIWLI